MHAVLEMALPAPVEVAEDAPFQQLPACPRVTLESGELLTLPYPALTPVERKVSLPLNAVSVTQ